MQTLDVRVECHSGYRSEETPRRFDMGHRRVELTEVLDRWLAPDYRYFKVRGDDGAVYILRQDMESHRWEIVLYGAAR